MTERKKPGPKPKCKECGRKEGMGHEDDCPVGLGVIATFPSTIAEGVQRLDPTEPVQVYRDPFDAKLAQAYAQRIWDGQSLSLPRNERLKRVKAALEAQGLSMEGVEL